MKLQLCFTTADGNLPQYARHVHIVDYVEGDVEPLVKELAKAGLGISTQSLMLKLISTLEELSLHQEHGFRLDVIGRMD